MKILTLRNILIAAFLLAPLKTLIPQQAGNQPVGAQRTAQFENDEVSVWKTVIPPNQPLPMHTHRHPRVIVALVGGTMKVQYEHGESEAHNWETGKAYWLPTSEGLKLHSDVNTGSAPVEVMVVELKKAD
jgi:quercetin dioxygenase-like cupin family protein